MMEYATSHVQQLRLSVLPTLLIPRVLLLGLTIGFSWLLRLAFDIILVDGEVIRSSKSVVEVIVGPDDSKAGSPFVLRF